MLYLVTGKPGNGKTLRAMDMMRQEYERNKAANALPQDNKKWEPARRFFSNVKGATKDENPEAFPWVERMPDHNDWTKLPDGSYVQYDEAHSDGKTPGLERYGHLFPSTGKPGESDDPRIRAMSTHRHRGFDIVLITQWPTKIHHQVRPLVNQHTHMSRAFGLQSAGVLTWHNNVQLDPYDEDKRDKAEEEIWTYPVDLYSRYTSATLHTSSHKFKMPRAIWRGLSVLIGFVIMLACFIYWLQNRTLPGEDAGRLAHGQERVALAAPAGEVLSNTAEVTGTGLYQTLKAESLPRIAGYIMSERGCRVWNDEGQQLDIPQTECVRLVEQGIPVSFSTDSKSKEREREIPKSEPVALPFTGATAGGDVAQQAAYGSMRNKEYPEIPLSQNF